MRRLLGNPGDLVDLVARATRAGRDLLGGVRGLAHARADLLSRRRRGRAAPATRRLDDLLDRYSGSLRTGGSLRTRIADLRRVVVLLDSAAVAAFLDVDDSFHPAADRRLRTLLGRERGIASVVTYAELLTGAALGRHDDAVVRGFFSQLVDHLAVVDERVAERAAELRAGRTSLRMPDAIIRATAEIQGADVVVSADRRWLGIPGYLPEVELLPSD